jgi:hypothetical protein
MLILTGCFSPRVETRVVTQAVYPDLPPMSHPTYTPEPVAFDWPRTKDGKVDTSSNLYIGLTEDGYKALRVTVGRLTDALAAYKARLDEINAQRAQWRAKNATSIVQK